MKQCGVLKTRSLCLGSLPWNTSAYITRQSGESPGVTQKCQHHSQKVQFYCSSICFVKSTEPYRKTTFQRSKVFSHFQPLVCNATFDEHKYPGDEVPDFNLATADGIKPWKERKHIGSPTSILFFTKEQQQLWNEKRVLLMSDYSTGEIHFHYFWRSVLSQVLYHQARRPY